MKIDPFPTSDPTMKTVAFSHPNDTHGDAMKGTSVQDLFEKVMTDLYPDCELSKTTRDDDKKGIDYISGNRKIALTSCWADGNDTYSKYTICSSKDSKIPHIFDTNADIFVVYSVAKKEFLIMSVKDIQRYAKDKFPGIENGPDGLEAIYFADSSKIVNYRDSAIEKGLIHRRHRGGILIDYFVYPERDVLISSYNAKVIKVPEHLFNGVVYENA